MCIKVKMAHHQRKIDTFDAFVITIDIALFFSRTLLPTAATVAQLQQVFYGENMCGHFDAYVIIISILCLPVDN